MTAFALEQQLSKVKDLVKKRDVALRLSKNKDFKELILEGFCTTEAARLVHESADPALTREQRDDSLAMAQAGGHLRRYLSILCRMADTAEANIPELEEALAEARVEEANDGEDLTESDGGLE
jgi:hypothetical protein